MYQPQSSISNVILKGVFVMASATQYPNADGTFLKTGDAVTQVASYSSAQTELQERFAALVKIWKRETGMQSSIRRIIEHEAYKEIIQMREAALPLIFEELNRNPSHWFTALTAITNARPVKPEDVGHMQKMADAWLRWGKDHGWAI